MKVQKIPFEKNFFVDCNKYMFQPRKNFYSNRAFSSGIYNRTIASITQSFGALWKGFALL